MTSLVLKVTSPQNSSMGPEAIKTFGIEGGTIGRAAGNSWILPDPARFLSSQHALVSFQDNQFFVTDLSSNGLFINGSSEPIGKGNTVPCSQIHTIALGEFAIEVKVNNSFSQAPSGFDGGLADGLLASTPNDDLLLSEDMSHDPLDLLGASPSGQAANHFDLPADLFGDDDNQPGSNIPEFEEVPQAPQIDDVFIAPNTVSSPDPAPTTNDGIPENWDKTLFTPIQSVVDDPFASPPAQAPTQAPLPTPVKHQAKAPMTAPVNKPDATNVQADSFDDPFNIDFLDADSFGATEPNSNQAPLNQGVDESLLANPNLSNDQTLFSEIPSNIPEAFEKPQPTTAVLNPHQAQQSITPAHQASPQPSYSSTQENISTEASTPLTTNTQTNPFNHAKAAFKNKGLDPALLDDPNFVDQAAALLPYFLDGTLDILRSRANIKNELRASKTILQPIENNPLKFSINLQDSVHNVLVSPRPGFMKPTDSVEQAFDDLAQHETALIAGIQAGLNGLLEKMSPTTIESKIESLESKKNLFGKISTAKKWEFYKETYQQILDNSSDSFIDMFGNDFVKAYESHINNHK
jgi:type VI secretion system FHA domain protein